MVLVAITGPVGSGKTTLLAEFVQWMQDGRRPVDGFLAVPLQRKVPGQGASEYVLQWIGTGERQSFVVRDETMRPPYRINPETANTVERWAHTLGANPPVPLIVLDEFGPMEAAGGGHLHAWPAIRVANPEVVVISVRQQVIREVEVRLGCRFDVTIDPREGAAADKLRSVVLHHADWTMVGVWGAVAGGFEASVGSALHAANVPLRGLFLASVQSMVMLQAGERLASRGRVVWVPFVSAGLKALSPAGNRVRPMIAIAVQGVLFGAATLLAGWNALGLAIGGWLIGAWSAGQGLLFQYLFVGQDFLRALDVAVQWLSRLLRLNDDAMFALLAGWIALCGGVTAIATLWAWQTRHRRSQRFAALLERGTGGVEWAPYRPSRIQALLRGIRDLLRPQFWVPLLLIVAVLLSSGSTWENALWVVVRATAIAWVLFSLLRMIDPNAVVMWLEKRGHWGPALAFRRALSRQTTSSDQTNDEDQNRSDNRR